MEVYKQFLGSVIRWILTLFFGWLIQQGIVSESDASIWIPQIAVGILGIFIPLVVSLWQKIQARLEFLVAQRLPVSATTAEVKEAVAVAVATNDMSITEQVKVAVAPDSTKAVI